MAAVGAVAGALTLVHVPARPCSGGGSNCRSLFEAGLTRSRTNRLWRSAAGRSRAQCCGELLRSVSAAGQPPELTDKVAGPCLWAALSGMDHDCRIVVVAQALGAVFAKSAGLWMSEGSGRCGAHGCATALLRCCVSVHLHTCASALLHFCASVYLRVCACSRIRACVRVFCGFACAPQASRGGVEVQPGHSDLGIGGYSLLVGTPSRVFERYKQHILGR